MLYRTTGTRLARGIITPMLLVAIAVTTTACTGSSAQPTPSSPAAADIQEGAMFDSDAAIRSGMAKLLRSDTQVDRIAPGPLPGLSEVTVGGRIADVSTDGKHFVQGPIIALDSMRNLTQLGEAELHRHELAQAGPERRIIFPSTVDERFRVTVFTDVECGYCQQLHKHIAEYNHAGITVEYLMYPRGGVDSTAAKTMGSVWCAGDRRQALTDAMVGKPVPEQECLSPVAQDYALGQRIGVAGTPAIFTQDGLQVGGFLPPEQLLAALEAAATAAP